jgi:hypothetical protein
MLLVARQAVEAFGDDDVELLLARIRQKSLIAPARRCDAPLAPWSE